MVETSRFRLWSYGIALFGVIIAIVFDLFFEPLVKADAPLLAFTIAVMLIAWYCGFGPGIFATFLSGLVSTYFFLNPAYSFFIQHSFDRTRLVLFLVTGVLVSIICESLIQSKKQAEKETVLTQESESRFRALADNNVAGVMIADETGRLSYVNDAFLRTVGYNREDFESGKVRWDKITSPDWMSVNARVIAKADGRVISRSFEERLRRRDGNFVSVLMAPAWTKTKDEDLLVCTILDITGRKRAEEELRRSNENFQALIKATTQAVWSVGKNGRSRDITNWWENLTGQALDKFDSWQWLDVVHPDDREPAKEAWSFALENKTVFDVEYRVKNKIGAYQYFAVRGVPVFDDAGDFTQWVGTFTDITARKSAEEALRESEERLNTVIENLSEGLVISDLEGNLLLWNRAALELYGFDPDSDQIRPLKDFPQIYDLITLDGKVLEFEDWVFPRLYRGEKLVNVQLKLRRKDIEWERIFEYGGGMVKDSTGRKVAFVTIMDITERKKFELETTHLNETLEQRVVERTAQLEIANKELEAFSYSVSHDLRAPLRHINGFSQALMEDYEDKLDEFGKDYLNHVRSASQEMAQLIDDLLHLSRVTRSEMRFGTVNLSEIAHRIISDLRHREPNREITVNIEENLLAYGDKQLLKVVLDNLLGNAWKFTHKNQSAEITFGQKIENGATVFFVRDNGAGFDMTYADKLFGAFQRLHSAKEFEGTGIGLATVQRIINRHGGRVWAEGKVGKEAVFYFILPDFKETQQ